MLKYLIMINISWKTTPLRLRDNLCTSQFRGSSEDPMATLQLSDTQRKYFYQESKNSWRTLPCLSPVLSQHCHSPSSSAPRNLMVIVSAKENCHQDRYSTWISCDKERLLSTWWRNKNLLPGLWNPQKNMKCVFWLA